MTRIVGGAVVGMALLVVLGACDGAPRNSPAPSATSAARDYCAELGFVDGEERDESGALVAECRLGPTPEGGAYSIARYRDADGPADKDDATEAEITEYSADGDVIQTTTGTLGDD